jgi:hypothetical protein
VGEATQVDRITKHNGVVAVLANSVCHWLKQLYSFDNLGLIGEKRKKTWQRNTFCCC